MSKRAAAESSEQIQPTRKSRRRSRDDRVILDVGGKQFVTARSTLIANSSYFAAKFSDRWTPTPGEDDEDDDECCCCFVDQNPTPFAALLEYMREGVIRIEDLDAKVLIQAEYLGIDTLIAAVKVASYVNMQPNFSGSEEEAIQEFDSKYGGITRAITSGHLPRYLKTRIEGKDDYAILEFPPMEFYSDFVRIKSSKLENGGKNFPLLGAINWLHFHGYTDLEEELKADFRGGDQITFSRKSLCSLDFPSTHILIGWKTRKPHVRKTFALSMSDREQSIVLYVPQEEASNESVTDRFSNTRWCTRLRIPICALNWLQDNGYVCREKQMETRFEDHMDKVLKRVYFPDTPKDRLYFQIYSRILDAEEPIP